KAEPDIIVITGDVIDSRHTDIGTASEFVKNAIKIAPCYYVTGNHEARAADAYPELETEMKNCGVKILRDEAVFIEKGSEKLQLIGVDDPMFAEREAGYSSAIIDSKLNQIEPFDGFKILLSHRPEIFDVYVKHDIDLVFSGHAHGGQFRIPFIGGVGAPNQGLFPKYDSGVYHRNKTDMIVSRGIGNSYIRVRINNRPEVILATLKGGE
ncbi:MAG: metallophosphoesterase, partial [Clostridia bacterium]|nr:metallophosphoesterase [Clostridia bacterium]